MAMTESQRQQLIDTAVRTLKEAGAQEVYLFGSAAKGTMREDSDIDLAVRGLPPEDYCEAAGRLLSVLPTEVTLIDLDEDSPFVRYLSSKGELQRVG